jgi:hypothetical protein
VRALQTLGVGLALAMLAWFLWFGSRGVLSSQETRAARQAGESLGRSTTDEACLTETLARGVACRDDVHCEAQSTAFLRGCLAASRPTAGFCDGVPSPSELLPAGTWSKRVWDAQGRPHHGGLIADAAVREFCHVK